MIARNVEFIQIIVRKPNKFVIFKELYESGNSR